MRIGLHLPLEQRPRATCAVCLVQQGSAYWVHVGDSRIYLLRQGAVAARTRDHSHVELLLREVEIECLPGDIPSAIEADVSELVFGKVMRVSDLARHGKLKFLTDETQPVAHVITVKEEVVAAPEVVAAEAGATPAEPEVIKKGKQETEGDEKADKGDKADKKEKK